MFYSESMLYGIVTSHAWGGAGAEGRVAADVSGMALLPEHH